MRRRRVTAPSESLRICPGTSFDSSAGRCMSLFLTTSHLPRDLAEGALSA
jgi:hypothetical protein